jgi:maleamate amidohydrolase
MTDSSHVHSQPITAGKGRGSEGVYDSRGFGKSAGFGRRPGLVVIDMMTSFTDPRYAVGFVQDDAIGAISRLAKLMRSRGLPVVFVTTHYSSAGPDAGVMGRKIPGLYDLVSGSAAVKVDPRLVREDTDLALVKPTASAFYGTELDRLLATHGVDTVVTTGCTTSGCVRATVVDGIARGFRMVVPVGAVADRAADAGEASLVDIDAKYGDVLSEAEVAKAIRGFQA